MHHFWFLTSKCDPPAAAPAEQAALDLEHWVEVANEAGDMSDATAGLCQFAAEAGTEKLHTDITQIINKLIASARIHAFIFKEFLVQ